MHCVDDQITFRIPSDLARALARQARERGVPKSQLVREAVRSYLTASGGDREQAALRERLRAYRGVVRLDRMAVEADPTARQISEHNWRE